MMEGLLELATAHELVWLLRKKRWLTYYEYPGGW